jgi:PAS domain S-box-containing protein
MIEDIRLQAIARFVDFAFENDPELLEIVELASAISNTPYALITFLDKDTQHLKVRKGVSETKMPREISFCTHAIQQDDLMLIPDTLKDERFVNNPLVAADPGIRFYAGVPLTTFDGQKLGTLCVLDVIEHTLTDHQQLVLKILGNQVMKILELRIGLEMLEKNQKELAEQREYSNDAFIRLKSFFESSTNFLLLLGKKGEVIDFNKTAFSFIKTVYKTELKRDDQFIQYIHPDFAPIFTDRYHLALLGKKSLEEGSTDYEELGVIWWEATFEAARDKDNEIIGVSYVIRDVTERKIKEQKIIAQNQSLLKIAHIQAHEFRAPLTSIMGLMSLIKAENYAAPKEYLELLEQAVYTLDGKIRQIVSNVDNNVVNNGVTDYH